ncbi:neuroligin-3-like [Palaemon carinicauda]|uniref:neuroligin-3-like n=1 Tax=Palaemon carinicauda TaxID=392227 RepID=UPI0035B59F0F
MTAIKEMTHMDDKYQIPKKDISLGSSSTIDAPSLAGSSEKIIGDDVCLERDKSSLRMTTAIFFFLPNNSGEPTQGRTMHENPYGALSSKAITNILNESIALVGLPRKVYSAKSFRPSGATKAISPGFDPNMVQKFDAAVMAYPVVVFLQGESFEWGSSSLYDGSVLAALGKVIVVTLNYRLGILGFFNANADPVGRPTVANYGLMDQLAALHWVQANIVRFGGDPGQVTVMGHGTGAACLNYLVISPAATGQSVQLKTSRFQVAVGPSIDGVTIKPDWKNHQSKMGKEGRTPVDLLLGLTAANLLDILNQQEVQEGFDADYREDLLRSFVVSNYRYNLQSGNESLLLNELAYVFGGPLGALGPLASSYNFTKMDITLSKSFISMWSNFIKLGHPKDTVSTAKMSESANDITSEEQIWPKYDPVHQRYFQIGTQNYVRDHYRAGKVALWSWLLPGLERMGTRYGPDNNFHRLPTDFQSGLYPESTGQYNLTDGFLSSPMTPTFTGSTNIPYKLTIVVKDNKNQVSESPNLDMLSQMGKDFTYTTALSVTVAIACSLLFLNILVLTIVYYRHKAHRWSLAKGSRDANIDSGNDVQLQSSRDNCMTIYAPEHYGTLRPSITMRSNLATAFEEGAQHEWPPDYISSIQTIYNMTGVTSNRISPDTQGTITNTQTLHEPKENILTVTMLKQPVASYTSPNDGQLVSTYSPLDGQLVPTYSTKENQLVQNYSPNVSQTNTSYSPKDGQLIPNYLSSSASTMHIRK